MSLYMSDVATIGLAPNYSANSPFVVLQSCYNCDADDKLQGSFVCPPLTSLESSVVGSDTAPHTSFQSQDYYHTSTQYECSAENKRRFYSKVSVNPANKVIAFNDMSMERPSSFCNSSLQSISIDGSEVQINNHDEFCWNSQMAPSGFVQQFDGSSKRQSIERTLRALEDALFGSSDEDEADLKKCVMYNGASGVSSDLYITNRFNESISTASAFHLPQAQAPKDALSVASSNGCKPLDVSGFTFLPSRRADPLVGRLAPMKNKAYFPQDLLETVNNQEQLLVLCSKAISISDLEFAQRAMAKLNQVVSIYGNPMERLAAYMVESLAARLKATGKGLYKALRCKDAPSPELLSAMQVMYEACPYFKFGYTAANGAIAEALKGENRIHILDFEIGQGSQWVSLIQALGARPGGPPELRITGIGDPEAEFAPAGGLQAVGIKLAKVAESVNMKFQFHARPMKLQDLQRSSVDRHPDEAFAVNSALQLHHVPDESVCPSNHRDRILRLLKSWNPKVLVLIEQEANTNTCPFFPRFMETLSYYSAIFESLDVTLPRESRDRVNVEQMCLARDIVNIIACEGVERVERYEVSGKWRARMAMAGLKPYPLSSSVNSTIKSILHSYSTNYSLEEEAHALHLGWLNRKLIVASAWH